MYKWAVYLNNKCRKEQPEALCVVGNQHKNSKMNEYGGKNLKVDVRHKSICIYLTYQ